MCGTIPNVNTDISVNKIPMLLYYSGIEYGGCVMDTKQMDIIPSSEPDQSDHSESEPGSDRGKNLTLC